MLAAERRGDSSALLAALIERYRTDGITRFYLCATAAGRPVYERLGFRALADVAIHLVADLDRT